MLILQTCPIWDKKHIGEHRVHVCKKLRPKIIVLCETWTFGTESTREILFSFGSGRKVRYFSSTCSASWGRPSKEKSRTLCPAHSFAFVFVAPEGRCISEKIVRCAWHTSLEVFKCEAYTTFPCWWFCRAESTEQKRHTTQRKPAGGNKTQDGRQSEYKD